METVTHHTIEIENIADNFMDNKNEILNSNEQFNNNIIQNNSKEHIINDSIKIKKDHTKIIEPIQINRKSILEKHFLFLQLLKDKNIAKKEEKKLKELKNEKIKEKVKENLGWTKVKSKLLENIIKEDNSITNSQKENNCSLVLPKILKKKKNKKNSKRDKSLIIPIEYKTVPNIKEKIISREKSKTAINLKNCNSLEDWKRRHRIENDKKVFICFNGYPDMKKALLSRGWVENEDPESYFFDFKYMLSGRNLSYEKLSKNQIINHFLDHGELTRKGSLCKNLKNLIWFRNINPDTFYPRCYNLNETNDLENFIENFKITKAESILKEYLENKREISDKIILTSLKIVERKLKDINEIIDNKGEQLSITNKEWDIICEEVENNNEGENQTEKNEKKRSKSSSMKTFTINNKDKENNIFNDIKANLGNLKKIKRNENVSVKNNETYLQKVKETLEKLEKKDPQFYLDGYRNIWIMKPSGLSRGRGIKCVSSLSESLWQIKSGCNQYVIQKYIENPMIIHNKKFDIRQWVLVTNFNPLTVYIYDEPYLRFSAEKYNPENISNIYSHLTNNSIAVKSSKFDNSVIEENMWDINQFSEYLKLTYNEDVYNTKIKEKLKQIIIYTLESVQDVIINRKNSHEIFGFDLMIDDKFNVWLIEVNSSPCMDYSTQTTKRLVKLVMDDLCKVIIDKKKDENADTGLWNMIHKGKFVEDSSVPSGFNLICEGVKYNVNDENNKEN